MGIESATKIADLNPAWPLGGDMVADGDNHIRLIKDVLQKDAAALTKANRFKASLAIEADTPYLNYTETDVAANIGNWSIGLSGGNYQIQPRDSGGLVLNGGRLDVNRDSVGLTSIAFSFKVAGNTMSFDSLGIVNFTRGNYGQTRFNQSSAAILLGGESQSELNYFFSGMNSAATSVVRIAANGNITNANNSYGAISDARLKSDIQDAGPQLEDVLALHVVNFTLIDDPEQMKQIGLIAQDVAEVKPGLVEEDRETGMLGVKYSVLVPILVKALQELAARVAVLEARP